MPEARYYFRMIEGEWDQLGRYEQRPTALAWENWQLVTFGQYVVDGVGNVQRDQFEKLTFAAVDERRVTSPAQLAAQMKVPVFDEVDAKLWLSKTQTANNSSRFITKMSKFLANCLPCDIVTGKQVEPGGVIYENDYWHVGSAMGPTIWRGFLIIKLKRHCEHLAKLIPEEAATLGPIIRDTCQVLSKALKPAKVYVCSFGDGTKHIHFWALPRPPEMRPGMHPVMFNLDMRLTLTRLLGIKKWVIDEEEVNQIANRLRECFAQLMRNGEITCE